MKLVTSESASSSDSGNDGRNFVLGMKREDAEYKADYAMLAKAFPYLEAEKDVPKLAEIASIECLKSFEGGNTSMSSKAW